MENNSMRKWYWLLGLTYLSVWLNTSWATCTKEEILKFLDKGFDKQQIDAICNSDDNSTPSRKEGETSRVTQLRVKFVDHIIAYDGIFESDGNVARLKVKLYDSKTQSLIKEETGELELVETEQGKGFRTQFFIPADSVTPKPHYHEVTLIFSRDENGSVSLQNCNSERCYPGEVKAVGDESTAAAQPSLSGAFQLEYTPGTFVHQALLIMTGSSGKMRVRYFNPATERAEIVEMQMQFRRTLKGDIIEGYNPIEVKTGNEHPSYAADNFIIRRYPDGELRIFNVDDNQVATEVELVPIETKKQFRELLRKFQWKLAIPQFEQPLR
jgi:hypothetical protein